MRMTQLGKSEVALYVVTAVLTVLVLIPVLRLNEATLSVPLQPGGDETFYQGIVAKPLTTQWWYLDNPSLAAPDGLLLYDYPTGTDTGLYLIMKLIAVFFRDSAAVVNIFYLLTYPLAALGMLFAARYLRLGKPIAVSLALLYAFAPYHFARGQGHLALSAYFMLPIGLVLALDIDRALGAQGPSMTPWRRVFADWRFKAGCIFSILVALTGVYYAFFFGIILMVVAIRRVIDRRRWASLALPTILGALVAATVALSAAPTFIYQAQNGPNPLAADRGPGGAEIYALRLIQLMMPPSSHRIAAFDAAATQYKEHLANINPILVNESSSAALGIVASVGFVFLLAWAVLGVRASRDGPWAQHRMGDLATINITLFLLGTAGGLGLVVAALVTPMLRAYNRVSIAIAMVALLAVGAMVDRIAKRSTRRREVLLVLSLAVLIVGLLDQTQPVPEGAYAQARSTVEAQRDFGDSAEALLPDGAQVLQLPYVAFPGSAEAIIPGFGEYELLLPYVYSDGLKWSFGAMNGRSTAEWQKRVSALPVVSMLDEARAKGFAAIYVDRNGFLDRGDEMVSSIVAELGPPDVTSADRRMLLWAIDP